MLFGLDFCIWPCYILKRQYLRFFLQSKLQPKVGGNIMTYNVLLVAEYIISFCNKNNLTISNLRLQKVLYFIQAEFLISRGHPCFPEEIEAWDFGPVVPEVYQKYKLYGGATIPCNNYTESGLILEEDRKLIDSIIMECTKYTTSQLVEITHNQTPWKQAHNPYGQRIITISSIKEFFSSR